MNPRSVTMADHALNPRVRRPSVRPAYSAACITLIFGLALGCSPPAAAHDLMASLCTVRLKPDQLELQIKMAADSTWPLVQEKIAPGAVFVLEDFEIVGKPLLIALARTLEELTLDGRPLALRAVDAEVHEDNFIFTLVYERPHAGVLRLKETYLLRMPAGYLSRVRLLDSADQALAVKNLRGADISFEIALPLRPASAGPPSPAK